MNLNSLIPWLLPLGVVSGGLILGFVFEWVVLRYFRAATKKTAWKWDDIISQASRRSISGLVFVGGVWLAALYAPISPDLKSLIYKIAGAVATVIATFLLARIVAGFIELGMNSVGQAFASASLITNSVKLLIIIIGVLFVVNGFVPITPVIGALGIGGLAAALALQDTLSNLFAGFQIIATRKIRPGDYIQLETGQLGRVVDISWRNVTIESHPDQNLVVVPNSKIATTVMTNYNLPHKLLMDFINVGVSYDSDLRRVKEIAMEEAIATIKDISGADKLQKLPVIRFREFGDFSIIFQVRMYLPQLKGRGEYRSELIIRLHQRFKKEGIEIPFPIRTVHLPDKKN